MKVKSEKTLQIQDLTVKVIFEVEGERKYRTLLTDEELKGKMIDLRV